MAYENHWLPGFNFNVEEWDAKGLHCKTLAVCRSLALARVHLCLFHGGFGWWAL